MTMSVLDELMKVETAALIIEVASGDALSVRRFHVQERISGIFNISVTAMSNNPDIDLDQVVGKPARFVMRSAVVGKGERIWTGLCSQLRQVTVEENGSVTNQESEYQLTLVPDVWLLSQRTNYRIFQYLSEPEIAVKILREWGIKCIAKLGAIYKKRKYRVQYGETDLAFVSRMLEESGVCFYFEQTEEGTKLVLADGPERNPPRQLPLTYADNPSETTRDFATRIRTSQMVRPGRYTIRDHDYRLAADMKLAASAAVGGELEQRLESYTYNPGEFLFGIDSGDETPNADDKGKTRTDIKEAESLVQKRLDAERADRKLVHFETNAHDVSPGDVLTIVGHPRSDLGLEEPLLVLEASIHGGVTGSWMFSCEARSAKLAFRPPLHTQKPKVSGVESATVVGPAGAEIHCDEFGRVRVHFHWDRESKMTDESSCWIHVSQSWGGAGYGGSQLPRVGQEVIVDFLSGDPDRPIIVGRVYTNLQKTPYKLPENMTQSGLKSCSTGGTGGYNELMMEDKAGQELLRIRAEKDRSAQVNNNCSTNVGKHRSTKVGGNGSLRVKGNRNVSVGGRQDTMVVGECTLGSIGSMTLSTSENFGAFSVKNMDLMSGVDMSLTCPGTMTLTAGDGASTIILSKNAIIIDGPKVFVNPGKDQIQNILSTGDIVQPDEPEVPSVMNQLLDKAKQAVEFAKQNPWVLAPLAAPLVAPLLPVAPLLAPIGIGIAAGEAIRRATAGGGQTKPSVLGGGGDFGGGGAGGGW